MEDPAFYKPLLLRGGHGLGLFLRETHSVVGLRMLERCCLPPWSTTTEIRVISRIFVATML